MTIDDRIKDHLRSTTAHLEAPDDLESVMRRGRARRLRGRALGVGAAAAVVASFVGLATLVDLPPADDTATPVVTSAPEPSPTVTTPVPEATTTSSAPAPTNDTCTPNNATTAQSLPAAVAATRDDLTRFAAQCNREGLAQLALFYDTALSFGAPVDDPVVFWEQAAEIEPEDPISVLQSILATEPAYDDEAGLWAWPAVHVEPTDQRWEDLAAVIGQDRVDEYRESGSGYLGYRVGIADDGTWLFFIAGD